MNAANKITLSRILIPFIFLPVLMSDMPYGKTIALFLFVIASISDWLDGYIARKLKITSDFGSLIDPLADKILISAALICFIIITPDIVKPWYVVVIISRDFLVTGLRLLAAKKDTIMAAESIGKHKTAWQMIAVISTLSFLSYIEFSRYFPERISNLVLDYVPFVLRILYVVIVALTLISGALYLWRYRSLYKNNL
ncbi:MAG: CDP-diacylglycerol--glycerol-3-phosphate 3-phosphatidyltransferase [Chlamydiae bacterium]|nr:MAG: CDP-diacylglycerol--glycerol-3-phosphate 3-phosphatidyltransferase [Chlamydiota bacterium]